jgi:hypothetical protein
MSDTPLTSKQKSHLEWVSNNDSHLPWILRIVHGDGSFYDLFYTLEKIELKAADEPSVEDQDHLARFTEYVVRELPAGTVIGDPRWWARKLLAAAIVTAPELPAVPPPAQASKTLAHLPRYVRSYDGMEQSIFGTWLRLEDAQVLLRSAEPPVDHLRTALQKIIDEGDYTNPEGMKRIAREALAHTDELPSVLQVSDDQIEALRVRLPQVALSWDSYRLREAVRSWLAEVGRQSVTKYAGTPGFPPENEAESLRRKRDLIQRTGGPTFRPEPADETGEAL